MLNLMSRRASVRFSSVLLLMLSGCGGEESESDAKTASATVAALGMSGVTGSITITAGSGNVSISGTLMGLPPSTEHGFHLHEFGDCGDSTDANGTVTVGGAAGSHWNPAMAMHGAPEAQSHLGDLGNVTSDAAGMAEIAITKAGITVGDGAATDIIGRAVIVHANPDDLTSQPVGNAGGRVACGVIQ